MELLGAPAEMSDEADEAEAAESGAPEARVPDEDDGAPEVDALAHFFVGDENSPGGAAQVVVDPKPAASTGGEMAHRRQAEDAAAASAADEQVQDLWWSARYLVITRYLRPPGVPRHQRLSAWAVLLRLEIELIRGFESPLPKFGEGGKIWETWDVDRQRQEISLRVQRLEDVRREQQRLHLRRLGDWLLGRDEDRDELLYQRVLAEACQHGPVVSWMLFDTNPNWWRFEQLVPPGP